MKLQFIKENCCPICSDTLVVKEEVETDTLSDNKKIRQHVNGGLWEKRTFSCGIRLDYIPNFGQSEIYQYSECRNDEKYKEKISKRKNAKESILNFIDTLDTDDIYKVRLKEGHFWY